VKAEIKPRIDLINRTKLETVIPLSVPFIINADPSDSCNFQCKFCPTGDRKLMKSTPGRSHGVMDFNLYKKIIDDICEFEKPIKVLRLYKDGEPLLNPRLAEMIKYAKENKCSERIDTTTNASLLNATKNIEIIDAGLDRINISIEGINAAQYLDFSRYKIDFDRLVDNVRHLYENRKQCEIIVKINGDTLSEDDKSRFYDIFGNIADGVYIEHIMSCWPEFELNGLEINQEFGIYGQKITEVLTCPYPFYSFSINSDGTASTCFLDWSRKLIIGDTKVQSVKDIWNGAELFEYQRMFLAKKRKGHQVCGQCGQLSHGQPDNIDPHADELLEKLIASR
jgi:MoaA/NifB/PqqE/SkfB family radical SAM enzyme